MTSPFASRYVADRRLAEALYFFSQDDGAELPVAELCLCTAEGPEILSAKARAPGSGGARRAAACITGRARAPVTEFFLSALLNLQCCSAVVPSGTSLALQDQHSRQPCVDIGLRLRLKGSWSRDLDGRAPVVAKP